MRTRANVVLVVAVVAIVLLAVVAAVVSAGRDDAQADLATPEGTVQAYLEAVLDGDTEAAAALLVSPGSCDEADLQATDVVDSARVVLLETEVDEADGGATATVVVEVTELYDEGPFGSGGYGHTERLRLEEQDGGWRLSGVPWPLYDCSFGGAS